MLAWSVSCKSEKYHNNYTVEKLNNTEQIIKINISNKRQMDTVGLQMWYPEVDTTSPVGIKTRMCSLNLT